MSSDRAAEASRFAGLGRLNYHRNGWNFSILSIEAIDERLIIELEVNEAGGARRTFLWRKDQPTPYEWIEIAGMSSLVADGTEPEPTFNALVRGSPATRTRFRDDPIERLKIELDRFLDRRLHA